jgi:dihydrolipoamide dehydrogenase
MTVHEVDVAIIGAGTAGLNARRAAEAAGAERVVLLDPGPHGTTCARVGCMPSKLLIAAAEAAHAVRHADRFGLNTSLEVDGPRVLDRVQRERDRFVGFVMEGIDGLRRSGKLIEARARFTGPTTLAVEDGREVRARSVVIAAGSEVFVPPPYRGLPRELMLTNEDVFELEDLPESVLVVGIGVIGLELGQALARLGVRVTLVGLFGMVGPLTDPEVLASAREVFGRHLDAHFEHELHGVRVVEGGVEIDFTTADGERRVERFDKVLMGAGRVPAVRDLGLENTGVALDAKGMPAFDPETLQLEGAPIFLAGDVTGLRPLLHEASDEGRIAGRNAARFPEVEPGERRAALGVVFSEPQIATVGASHRELVDSGVDFRVGKVSYHNQGRARVMGVNEGLVRIYGAPDGTLLGAEMLGPRVENTGHLLAWAVQSGMTVQQALEMPFYHPVVEEGIRTALRDLAAAL